MLKLTKLFLPAQINPNADSHAFLFAGLAFPIPLEFFKLPFKRHSFYVAYDKFGLTICNEKMDYAASAEQFFCPAGIHFKVADYGTVPQECLDTYFGVHCHQSQYQLTYPMHLNWPFYSEDIDAMIDAIAPQSTEAN